MEIQANRLVKHRCNESADVIIPPRRAHRFSPPNDHGLFGKKQLAADKPFSHWRKYYAD